MIVKHGSNSIVIEIEDFQTMYHLLSVLEEKTGVPISNMKIISQGKVIFPDAKTMSPEDMLVKDIPKGSKATILMMGNSSYTEAPKELPRVRDDLTVEGRKHRGKYVIDANYLNRRSGSFRTNYRFHSIQTLPNLPEEYKAREILSSLASDPGVLAVLAKHEWSVGALCELYPEGYVGVSDVCILGLNENHGQRILLRLRTDDLKGFRKILTIKKVLYHELAHNVHSDHDDKF